MLHFSPLKAAATLLTALFICLVAVPNFFSEETVKSWPKWAQRHIVLGLDLQGGSHILLEVDTAAVRREQSQALLDDVRRVLREARVGYTGLAVRGNSVELRLREGTDIQQAMSKLNELSRPLSGILATRRPAQPRNHPDRWSCTPDADRSGHPRAHPPGCGAIDPDHRAPRQRARHRGAADPAAGRRPRSGAGAGLAGPDPAEGIARQDRQARFPAGGSFDSCRSGAAGRRASGFRTSLRRQAARALRHQAPGRRFRRRPDRRAARLRSAHQRADRQFPLQLQRRAPLRADFAGECRQAFRHRARQRGDQRAGDPRSHPRRQWSDLRQF